MDSNDPKTGMHTGEVTISELLGTIPEFGSWLSWAARIEHLASISKQTSPTDIRSFASIEGRALISQAGWSLESDPWWRLWAATLAADWAVYDSVSDRVDAARLLFVMARFSAGFRVWFGQAEAGWLPLGYTGWYPIEETSFRRLENNTPPLIDRAIVPLTALPNGSRHLYIFNYSIVQGFRNTEFSRQLMKALADDIAKASPAGLAAIAVSSDGIRVAERFGMHKTGEFALGGEKEWILTSSWP